VRCIASEGGLGVEGESPSGTGVLGSSQSEIGVRGISQSGRGMLGESTTNSGVLGSSQSNIGVRGNSISGTAVYGESTSGTGIFATGEPAGDFLGDVSVLRTLTKGALAFKIDHPLDPANKYLSHSGVESPDMKNIYDGITVLDASGEAVVELPAWFEALNIDFRYQLTCLGDYAQVYVAEKIHDHRFKNAGGKTAMEVSWQVTGIRHDAYANAHRIPVEQDKPAEEQGYYLHPGLHGEPEEKQVLRVRYPEISREMPLRK